MTLRAVLLLLLLPANSTSALVSAPLYGAGPTITHASLHVHSNGGRSPGPNPAPFSDPGLAPQMALALSPFVYLTLVLLVLPIRLHPWSGQGRGFAGRS